MKTALIQTGSTQRVLNTCRKVSLPPLEDIFRTCCLCRATKLFLGAMSSPGSPPVGAAGPPKAHTSILKNKFFQWAIILSCSPLWTFLIIPNELTHLIICHLDWCVTVGLLAWKARWGSVDCLFVIWQAGHSLFPVFFPPLPAAMTRWTLWQGRYGQGLCLWHLTCASKLTTGSKASKLYHKTAHLFHVKGFSSELLTWVNTTHVIKHYATSNLWGNGKDNYVSATLRSFFLTSHPSRLTELKPQSQNWQNSKWNPARPRGAMGFHRGNQE